MSQIQKYIEAGGAPKKEEVRRKSQVEKYLKKKPIVTRPMKALPIKKIYDSRGGKVNSPPQDYGLGVNYEQPQYDDQPQSEDYSTSRKRK